MKKQGIQTKPPSKQLQQDSKTKKPPTQQSQQRTNFNPYLSNEQLKKRSQYQQQQQQWKNTSASNIDRNNQPIKLKQQNNPWSNQVDIIQQKKSTFGMVESLKDILDNNQTQDLNQKEDQQEEEENQQMGENNQDTQLIQNKIGIIEGLVKEVQQIEKIEKNKLQTEKVNIYQAYPMVNPLNIQQNINTIEQFIEFFKEKQKIEQLNNQQQQKVQEFEYQQDQDNNIKEDSQNMKQYIRIPFEYRKFFLEILKKYGQQQQQNQQQSIYQGNKIISLEDYIFHFQNQTQELQNQENDYQNLKTQIDEFQIFKDVIYNKKQ